MLILNFDTKILFLLQMYIGSFINDNCYQPLTQPQSEMLKELMMPTLSACLSESDVWVNV